MTANWKFTSESVTPGHPDRLSDNIVENIQADILTEDPTAKVALEGLLGKGFFTLAGEVTTDGYVNIEQSVRDTITRIGYDKSELGLDGHSAAVLTSLSNQSPEIAGGVFNSLEARTGADQGDPLNKQGAGDQGIVFGTAVNHNTSYHPASHKLSMMLAEQLYNVRAGVGAGLLRPDGKTQVTLDFVNGKPVAIDTILISTQHSPKTSLSALKAFVQETIITPVVEDYNNNHALPGFELSDKGNYIINPAGAWSVGGPASDVGLVNRKIVADTTGGWGRHGGGGLNGKDFSKTDRSGVYVTRFASKHLVAAGLADQVEIQVGYAIGQATPVSVYVNTFGTEHVPLEVIDQAVKEYFDFRPLAIKQNLEPTPDAYRETAMFGHLGRNPGGLFPWETLGDLTALKNLL